MAVANVQGTLKVESQVLHVDKDYRGENLGEPIALFQDGVVLVSWNGEPRVKKLDRQKNLRYVGHYRNETGSFCINGLCTYNNNIYIAQKNTIKVESGEGTPIEYKPPNIPEINRILVVDESTILISDGGNPGSAYKYNTESNQTEVVLNGLNEPTYISMAESGEDTRYIVSESGGHCRILICDNNWTVIPNATITGPRGRLPWCPKAMAVTERGELLVADYNNSTINGYNLEGEFLGYVIYLDKHECPDGIAYKFPYLWVCSNNNNVRCFKMKYEIIMKKFYSQFPTTFSTEN